MNFAKIPQPKMNAAERDLPLGFMHSLGYTKWRSVFPALPAEGNLPSAKQERVIDAILSYLSYGAWMHPGRKVSYSRSKTWYAFSREYLGPDASYHLVRAAVDIILDCTDALADHWVAPSGPTGTGWQSTMTPNSALSIHASGTRVRQPGRALVMRGGKGGFAVVPKGEAAKAGRMESTVDAWNAVISAARIEVALPEDWTRDGSLARSPKGQAINTQAVSLTRIFTDGSFDKGGRYYGGWWQSLPSEIRGTSVTIDGGATVELDYSQIHPRMLYVLAGKKLDGDAYTIPGIARDDAKLGWQIVINADTLSSATAALSAKLAASREEVETKAHKAEARKIVSAVKAAHPEISAYFHTGIGIRLQRHDSDVATMVMNTMIGKGIVCLPIHDSFIVRADYGDLLKEVMDVAFERWCRDNCPADASTDGATVIPFSRDFSLHTLSQPGSAPSVDLPSVLGDRAFESGFGVQDSESFPGELLEAAARESGRQAIDLEDTFFPATSNSAPRSPRGMAGSEYPAHTTQTRFEPVQAHGKRIDRMTSTKGSDTQDNDMTEYESSKAARRLGPPLPPKPKTKTVKAAWVPMIRSNPGHLAKVAVGTRALGDAKLSRMSENGPLAGESGKADLPPFAVAKRPSLTNRVDLAHVDPAPGQAKTDIRGPHTISAAKPAQRAKSAVQAAKYDKAMEAGFPDARGYDVRLIEFRVSFRAWIDGGRQGPRPVHPRPF